MSACLKLYVACGGWPRCATTPASTSCARAPWSVAASSGATACSRLYGTVRPIVAPSCATPLAAAKGSNRARRASCRVAGIASGGRGPGQLVVCLCLLEQARLQHHLGELFHEQGHAIGLGH